MEFNSLIGPAVVAAIVAAIVAFINSFINVRTTRTIHDEKLKSDLALATRKVEADIALAERKFAYDVEIAERKRRSELAETVLVDFYHARDAIKWARYPVSSTAEVKTRLRGESETEDEARHLDAFYVARERLLKEDGLFSRLRMNRYKFRANFGAESAQPFEQIRSAHIEILGGSDLLIRTYKADFQTHREKFEAIIWEMTEDDSIARRVDEAVEAMEAICGPILRQEIHSQTAATSTPSAS